jgi:hypothetical protein
LAWAADEVAEAETTDTPEGRVTPEGSETPDGREMVTPWAAAVVKRAAQTVAKTVFILIDLTGIEQQRVLLECLKRTREVLASVGKNL